MRSWQPGYLSKHDDVEADAIGLDECAVLGASRVTVVLGKPGERSAGERERHRAGGTAAGSSLWVLLQWKPPRPRRVASGQGFALPAEQMTRTSGALPAQGDCAAGGLAC